MTWKVIPIMQQKLEFLQQAEALVSEGMSVSRACKKLGHSRTTFYKLRKRFTTDKTLQDHSRCNKKHPKVITAEMRERIIQIRNQHRFFGSAKVRVILTRDHKIINPPCRKTIDKILKAEKLQKPRQLFRRTPTRTYALSEVTKPNSVWQTDFKGHKNTQDNIRCTPFTMMDAYSRKILLIQHVEAEKRELIVPAIIKCFEQYGMPESIRTDGGPPFGNFGINGWSQLSIFFLRLHIFHERTLPGVPQENGALERFHRTLKQETMKPMARNSVEQQAIFADFKDYYNSQRPHAALGQGVPNDSYENSDRKYLGDPSPLDYGQEFQQLRVQKDGKIKFRGKLIFLSEALQNQVTGIKEIEDNIFEIYFMQYLIGRIDYRFGDLTRLPLVRTPFTTEL